MAEQCCFDFGEVLKLEEDLWSMTESCVYDRLAVLTVFCYLPGLDIVRVPAAKCRTAVSIVDLRRALIHNSPNFDSVSELPTPAVKSYVGPVHGAADTCLFGVLGEQVIRLFVRDVEADCPEYITRSGTRTGPISLANS